MQSNHDLNSNLIKSLTSVHLPPPPSSRSQLSKVYTHHKHAPIIRVVASPSQHQEEHLLQAQAQAHLHHIPYQEHVYQEALKTNIIVGPTKVVQQQTRSKRKSSTTDELQAPLNTPPHTVSRSDSRPVKKVKTQVTPTTSQNRIKKPKNPPSPQYSSPSSSNSTIPEPVSKPPPPAFITATKSKPKKPASSKVHIIEKVPSPSKMPKIVHDSDSKPPYSYATLIGMAILRGEDRKLTLSQIYSWISSTFKYYRKNDVGWQNSIRHNLSLNKAFIKTEKSSDGKGHFWEVVKGHEMQFIKGKSGKRSFGGVQLDQNDEGSKSSKGDSTEESTSHEQDDEDGDFDEGPVQQLVHSPRLSEETTAFKDNDETSSSESEDYDDYTDPDDVSRTPKAQIRSIDNELRIRPSLKKSHTTIGLQRISLENEPSAISGNFGTDLKKLPTKNPNLKPNSSSTNGSLREIPSLQAPDTNWAASASGQHIVFGQVKPSISIDSPPRATRFASFPSTSSFSCNTNFDLSPLKRQETGPLLEPLTPSSRLTSFTNSTEGTSISMQPSSFLTNPVKTPLRATSLNNQNMNSGLVNSSQISHFYSFLKTPNARNIRTPNSSSIMKKFWNSPSLMDDFYTSPSVPRNSDDDYNYKVGLFGSPENSKSRYEADSSSSLLNGAVSPTVKRKFNRSSSQSQILGNSNNYGVSDLFGVDICTVVQRAVENEKNHQHRSSITEGHDNNATDDELDGNVTA